MTVAPTDVASTDQNFNKASDEKKLLASDFPQYLWRTVVNNKTNVKREVKNSLAGWRAPATQQDRDPSRYHRLYTTVPSAFTNWTAYLRTFCRFFRKFLQERRSDDDRIIVR